MPLEDFECHEGLLTGRVRATAEMVHADPEGNFYRPGQGHGGDSPRRPRREF
jgi:hypothetical protein